jgi:hypothetical protein
MRTRVINTHIAQLALLNLFLRIDFQQFPGPISQKERDIEDYTILPEIVHGIAQNYLRAVLFDIDSQTLAIKICTGLYFNRRK